MRHVYRQVYICVCMHAYTDVHTHAYTHVYTHVNIHMTIYTCPYTCLHACLHARRRGKPTTRRRNYIGLNYIGRNYIGHNYTRTAPWDAQTTHSASVSSHVPAPTRTSWMALYRLDLGIADGM